VRKLACAFLEILENQIVLKSDSELPQSEGALREKKPCGNQGRYARILRGGSFMNDAG